MECWERLEVGKVEDLQVEEFLQACRDEVHVPVSETTIRERSRSAPDVRFRRFEVDSDALRRSCLFAASDTDAHRQRWIWASDPLPLADRRMITYAELLDLPELLASYLECLAKDRIGRPERSSARILTLHCSRCDARWLLDGNHGLVRIFASRRSCRVQVTEMTSPALGMRGCQCAPASGPRT